LSRFVFHPGVQLFSLVLSRNFKSSFTNLDSPLTSLKTVDVQGCRSFTLTFSGKEEKLHSFYSCSETQKGLVWTRQSSYLNVTQIVTVFSIMSTVINALSKI